MLNIIFCFTFSSAVKFLYIMITIVAREKMKLQNYVKIYQKRVENKFDN